MTLLLGAIADDFTGASDLANTLTRGGMRTVLTVGVPSVPAAASAFDADAVVVALKTRTIEPVDAVAQSLAAFAWLRKAGAQQILCKICSTFDSRFAIEPRGNIGPVGAALRLALVGDDAGASCVPVCPAFPANGRTVYRGHLFVGDQLLSESGMARHPLTPMTDANLVRVLQAQCDEERVGLVTLDVVRAGADAVISRLVALGQQGVGFAIVDAVDDADLLTLGTALDGMPLAIGGSGIALGLPANFARRGVLAEQAPLDVRGVGRCVLLAGSCSTATRAQVAEQAARGPLRRVDPARVAYAGYVAEVADWCLAQSATPLVASSAAPEQVAAARSVQGEALAAGIELFFGALAVALHARGVRRFVVAGGETSGAIVTALGIREMQVGPEIDPGVPALRAIGADPRQPLALALKSGNFGATDFFARAQQWV